MKNFVSIIVPVYRVEKYLNECVNSLVNQSYANCEIILVDDGSDDKCPELCDQLALIYNNIKVIHQKNKGQAAARNAGLEIANGDFIAFCDSDDRYKPDMIEKMIKIAINKNVDLVISGFETFPNGKITIPGFITNSVCTPYELIQSCSKIHSGNEMCFSWRFFVSGKLIREKKIRFNENISFGEDVLFNIQITMLSSAIFVLPEPLYEYRIDNPNSIMRTNYKASLDDKVSKQYVEKLKLNIEYGLNKYNDWVEDLAYYNITGFAGMLFRNILNSPVNNKKQEVKRILKLPILSDSYSKCGTKLFKDGKQNTLFRLSCQFRIMPIVMYYIKKWYS